MLDEPRDALERAELPLMPPPPPKAPPLLDPLPAEVCRFPTRSPPPFAAAPEPALPEPPERKLLLLPAPPLSPAPDLLAALLLSPALPLRWFCRADAWRLAAESPRAFPPNLLAVALSP